MSDGPSTVVFLDLVMFTSMTEVHGDVAAADAATAMEDLARDAVRPGSRLVKTVGDGVLITSPSPAAGLRCASVIVEGLHELATGLDARGGLDHGPVVGRSGDVFGSTVNIAARLAEFPPPGRLAMTRIVAESASEVDLAIMPRGHVSLKGFRTPIEIFEVDPCEHEGDRVTDPVCGMRLRSDDALWVTDTAGGVVGFCSRRCADIFGTDGEGHGSITGGT